MTWKENALGMTVERGMNVDFAALKSQGVSFVTIEVGTGWDFNPALSDQLKKAQAAGLVVLLQYTPIPALDDYTFEAPAREQLVALEKALVGKTFNALVISMERYWTGYDVEEGRNPPRIATPSAINHLANEMMNGMTKLLAPRGIQVTLRSNDKFVMSYSPGISGWSDAFGSYLADWRYRTRDAEGAWNVYHYFPALTIGAISELVARLPGDNTKNPLVPGKTPKLKFWEFTGSVTMPASLVKGWDGKVQRAKFALYNGSVEAMQNYLGIPSSGTPTVPDPAVPVTSIEQALARIVSLCERMAADITAIRNVFR